MPTKVEKDAETGTELTGHEWDGIKELDTPLPKWWLYIFYATILFALGYVVLYPAIPTGDDYTKGLLGYSSRAALEEDLDTARRGKARYLERFETASLAEIRDDDELVKFALAGGRTAFADNCVPCHRAGGAGAPGFPTLADDDWLWGGTLDDIYTTLQHGIRWSQDEETRLNDMPAFGRDDILERDQIKDVAEYVLSLSGREGDAAAVARGAEIFAENCVACHGEGGEGTRELGAPRLSDAIWLYGGDKVTVMETLLFGRKGVMPAWVARLDAATLKQLTVYVHSLGGGE